MTRARIAALAAAMMAWSGLALQLALLIPKFASLGQALWRFFGFFTILSNLTAAIVMTALALRPSARIAGPRARLAATAAVLLVGIVYSIALRRYWNPTGWRAVSDHMLHDASPLLVLLAWLLGSPGDLRWRDALWALPLPAVYFGYAMARGAVDGWYAYWFLDPARLPPAQFVLSFILLLAANGAIGLLLVGNSRLAGRWTAPING